MINEASKKGIPNPLNAKHYLSTHPAYRIWAGIKKRCYNSNDPTYADYGALGVIMCPEWKDNPEAFILWALKNGWEKGLQIDKDIIAAKIGIPPLLYSPETCLVVTRKENCNQRRNSRMIEYGGEKKTLTQWSEILGIKHTTLTMRLKEYGYSVERAFSEAVAFNKPNAEPKNQRFITRGGVTKNLKQWCEYYGTSVATFRSRMKYGCSFEEALTGKNQRERIPEDAKQNVRLLHKSGYNQLQISKTLNLSRTSVGRIVKSIKNKNG